METTTRTITVRPWKVSPYSRAITVPSWWLRLNSFPEELEVTFAMGEITVRPKATPAEPTKSESRLEG